MTQRRLIEPLPGYATAAEALEDAADAYKPLKRDLVSEAAVRRSIEVSGQPSPFRWDVAPYMREPGDLVTSRRFDSIVLVGPARCSKSEGLVINPVVHAILSQPRKVSVFSPTQAAAKRWSETALSWLIVNSPELAARLIKDGVFVKTFRGGTHLSADWPVESALSQRSLDLVVSTDHDEVERQGGGSLGNVFGRMRKRTEAAGSRGMAVAESSPRFPVLDETWSPDGPHQAPPCDGIVGLYNKGSLGRLYWTCPHSECGAQFIPEWGLIQYPADGTPAERGRGAYMVCPHCGGVIEFRARGDMNADAVWLHVDDGGALVEIGDLHRACTTASYWIPGPAAALAPWSRLVTRVLEAEADYADRGDEAALRSAYNVDLGLPYLPRSLSDAESLSASVLRERATSDAWQVCPPGTAFLTVAVDVQGRHFVVQVEAWQTNLSRVVIDRFDITQPPPDSPGAGARALSPSRYAEDWGALDPLIDRAYPVAGTGYALAPLGVICDSAGQAGVTPNAYDYYRRQRRENPGRFFLVKGRDGDNTKRAELRSPETTQPGRRHMQRGVKIVFAGTDRLKDEIAASLMRGADGARRLSVSEYAPSEMHDEYAAERRGDKGWEPRPGCKRNEALDLSVYALALAIVRGAEAINRAAPAARFAPDDTNARAVPLPADPETEDAGRNAPSGKTEAAQAAPPAPAPPKAPGGWSMSQKRRRR